MAVKKVAITSPRAKDARRHLPSARQNRRSQELWARKSPPADDGRGQTQHVGLIPGQLS